MTKRLAIDARWLRTGIGRYTTSALRGLREQLRDIEIVCITQPRYQALVADLCDHVLLTRHNIYTVQEQLILPWIAREASAFYSPHYNIPIFWRHRLLVTIHDLTHLLDATYRRSWRTRLYAKPLTRVAIEKADCIVTPSEYTKGMLYQNLQVSPDRVTVIPCAVSDAFHPLDKSLARSRVAREHGISRPYLLFVGSLRPNKNLPLLLDALSQLHQERRDAPGLVVVAADGRWSQEVRRYASAVNLDGVVHWLQHLTDSSLATLYSAALMTILPSFEEGFGFPVVESMACGTPVLCSAAGALPEVAGGASLLFSPYSSEELVDAIRQLLDSTSEQQKLIRAGLERAQSFSQENTAIRQAAAIRTLLSD